MAKGDKDAVNSAINAEQPRMNEQRNAYGNQLQSNIDQSRTQGTQAWNSAVGNYGQASQGFGNIASGNSFSPMSSGFVNQDLDSMKNAEALFNQFIGNGGYSDADTRNMRARAIAPTTSIYANAQEELNRNRALQGGYSPNYGAASAKMAREMSNQIGQANIANEANIAQARNTNQLAGAQGLTQLGLGKANARTSAESLAENSRQFGAGLQLQGNQGLLNVGNGLTNLYGTGNADLNNQLGMLGSNISGQQAGNLGLIGARIGAAGIASNKQNAMANIGSMMGLASQGANMMNAAQGQQGQRTQQYDQYGNPVYTGGTGSGGWDASNGMNAGQGNGWVGDGSYFPGMDTGYQGYGSVSDIPQYGGYNSSWDMPPSGQLSEQPYNIYSGFDSQGVNQNNWGMDEQGNPFGSGAVDGYNPYGENAGNFQIANDPTQDPNYWQGGQG